MDAQQALLSQVVEVAIRELPTETAGERPAQKNAKLG
jgi:hypothetical protein